MTIPSFGKGLNHVLVSLSEIERARERLTGVVHTTRLLYSESLSVVTGSQLYLKPENLQVTGSFKVRGAYNKISSTLAAAREHGVIAFSAGNHGAGTAYAAMRLGAKATVVMPDHPVEDKRQAILSYGADVVLGGPTSISMFKKAQEIQDQTGAIMVHPFDDPFIIAGQGTIGLEIIEELPDVDVVVVPVSGGGLISGIAVAIKEKKPSTRVIGVNSEGARAMYESCQNGAVTEVDRIETIADGLMAKRPGEVTFEHVSKYVDDLVLVSEENIARGVSLMARRTRLVVEPSGAAALAAAVYGDIELKGQRVVVIASGGNADMGLFARLVQNERI